MSILSTPWFYWSVILAIGLPTILVVLTELQHALDRRGSFVARPIGLLRTFIVPLGALLVLLTQTTGVAWDSSGVRILATVFGIFVLVMVLSGVSATVFQSAPAGSWRRRMPSIFIDVARFAIIAVGLALILAYIWGANVGGLFTALGVSSIVLGLTLQNSVGQIISGLLLLFEQPFQFGDWVETPAARGRVVEVNWRATHIDTGSGLEIIPNSVLAGQAFTNLSRPANSHTISVNATFGGGDPPDEVCALLTATAVDLPHLRPGSQPAVTINSSTGYTINIPVSSPADDSAVRSVFQRWLWYAARRAGLHLDGIADDFDTAEHRIAALRKVAAALRVSTTDMEALLPKVRVIRYGDQEMMQRVGEIPDRMIFVVSGRARLVAPGQDGAAIPVSTLYEGDFIGQTALIREAVIASAYAIGEVTALQMNRETVERLLLGRPELLQDLSQTIEERRARAKAAIAKAVAVDAGDSEADPESDFDFDRAAEISQSAAVNSPSS